jgi:hypothetical protein
LERSQLIPDDVRELLAKIAREDRLTYPLEDLIPYNQQTLTVERVMQALLNTQ